MEIPIKVLIIFILDGGAIAATVVLLYLVGYYIIDKIRGCKDEKEDY